MKHIVFDERRIIEPLESHRSQPCHLELYPKMCKRWKDPNYVFMQNVSQGQEITSDFIYLPMCWNTYAEVSATGAHTLLRNLLS